jgi:hypothetical protein
MTTPKKTVFIICSVRKANAAIREALVNYKQKLLSQGYANVHLPHLDTNQNATGYEICGQNTIENIAATEIHVFYDATSEGSHFDIGVRFVDQYLHPEKKFYVIEYQENGVLDMQDNLYRLFEEKFQGYERWIGILETMMEVDDLPVSYYPQNIQASNLELGMIFALCAIDPKKRINVIENRGIMDENGQYFILFERSFGTMIMEWQEAQAKKSI